MNVDLGAFGLSPMQNGAAKLSIAWTAADGTRHDQEFGLNAAHVRLLTRYLLRQLLETL